MEKADLKRWKTRISGRLNAISDPTQRTILLSEKLSNLEYSNAASLFGMAIVDNFILRDRPSRILLEAFMLVLLGEHWPEEHRQKTLKVAVKNGERLQSIFLGHVRPASQEEQKAFEVPDYGSDRPMTLGERRSLASRPNRKLLQIAIKDPHPMVVAKILSNPKLTVDDVVFLSSRRPAPSAALTVVATHPKFRLQRRVARTLINNPDLPVPIALTLLPCLDVPYIQKLALDPSLDQLIREAAKQILLSITNSE